MRKGLFLTALAALAVTPATAQPSSEWLAQGPLPGFAISSRQVDGGSMIAEYFLTGEAAEGWSRRVAIHRFASASLGDAWLQTLTETLTERCLGARYEPPVWSETDGRRTVAFRGDCPSNPDTDLPETFFVRAFAGTAAVHVTEVAFRHVPSPEETAWARAHLATVTLCSRDIATPPCRGLR
jgi:hypothetical protein